MQNLCCRPHWRGTNYLLFLKQYVHFPSGYCLSKIFNCIGVILAVFGFSLGVTTVIDAFFAIWTGVPRALLDSLSRLKLDFTVLIFNLVL